ncbi:unnamed protein product [Peniophora sp. CBMAI 1063]|nr:unnamed protein product [Peniophora sp. CBMAI 1063]
MQAGNIPALPPTYYSLTPDALEHDLLSGDILNSQPSPADDAPPPYDGGVSVYAAQYTEMLSILSTIYLEIAANLSTLRCASDADVQPLRKYSHDIWLLARSDSERPSGQLSLEFPSLAGYHIISFVLFLYSSPDVVCEACSHDEESMARVLTWLEQVAQVMTWNVIPTTTVSPVDDLDSFMFCTGAFDIFAPFMKAHDGCYEFAGLVDDDFVMSGDWPQSRESDDENLYLALSSMSLDERSHSPTVSLRERLIIPSSIDALRYTSHTGTYSMEANFYSVTNNVVSIHRSDALPSWRPPIEQDYVILPLGDPTHLSWRHSIGRLLSGAIFGHMSDALVPGDLWVLDSFPPDYVLARRTTLTREEDGTEKSLTEVYLYGGQVQFASPAEFAAHAIWLMRGAVPGDCACKHCSNASQDAITAVMEALVYSASRFLRVVPRIRRRASWNGETWVTEANTDYL